MNLYTTLVTKLTREAHLVGDRVVYRCVHAPSVLRTAKMGPKHPKRSLNKALSDQASSAATCDAEVGAAAAAVPPAGATTPTGNASERPRRAGSAQRYSSSAASGVAVDPAPPAKRARAPSQKALEAAAVAETARANAAAAAAVQTAKRLQESPAARLFAAA